MLVWTLACTQIFFQNKYLNIRCRPILFCGFCNSCLTWQFTAAISAKYKKAKLSRIIVTGMKEWTV